MRAGVGVAVGDGRRRRAWVSGVGTGVATRSGRGSVGAWASRSGWGSAWDPAWRRAGVAGIRRGCGRGGRHRRRRGRPASGWASGVGDGVGSGVGDRRGRRRARVGRGRGPAARHGPQDRVVRIRPLGGVGRLRAVVRAIGRGRAEDVRAGRLGHVAHWQKPSLPVWHVRSASLPLPDGRFALPARKKKRMVVFEPAPVIGVVPSAS